MEFLIAPMQMTGGCVPDHSEGKGNSGSCRIAALRRLGVLLVFVSLLPGKAHPAAEMPASEFATITTARSAHQLSHAEAARHYPEHLRGVVTLYNSHRDKRRPALFLSDESGSVFVALASFPAVELQPGQLIDVMGVSDVGDFAPLVSQATATVVGTGPLPTTAPRVSVTHLLTGADDGQWIEVEGIVRAVQRSGENVNFEVSMSDGTLTASTRIVPGVDYSALVDAKILLRGNEAPLFNHNSQLTGVHVLFPNLSTLTIEEPAPPQPFDQPVQRIGNLLRYTPEGSLQHRVHIQGTVTLLWPGRLLCLQEGGQGICAKADDLSILPVGARVDAIGFAMIGELEPTLVHTFYQVAGEFQQPQASTISASDALQGKYDARLVAIEGTVIGEDRSAPDPTIVLSAGEFIFSAVLPRESGPRPLGSLQAGSKVRLLGICSAQSDAARTDAGEGFSIAKSFRILLRSPEDVIMLQPPSWWSAAHTLRVLAVALAATLLTLFLVVILELRVRQQTQTIRDSEERFRLLATRDGLTQLPNRNSILAELSASLESAAASGGRVCVAILDLDHFKQVNDTFGHLAGDEVLQQAAIRLSCCIRNTDAIGRYGGEEFLIVFRDVDRHAGIERCERIRRIICNEPIPWAAHHLSISCSIGIASTHGVPVSAKSLIAEADDALYRAKASGRNRVEYFSPQDLVPRLRPADLAAKV